MPNHLHDDVVASKKNLPDHERVKPDSSGLIGLFGTVAGCALTVQVEAASGCVTSANHQASDDPACQGILNLLCASMTGQPIEEAAVCAASSVLRQISEQSQIPMAAGVLMPRNGGPVFAEIEAVLREMLKQLPDRGNAPSSRHCHIQDEAWAGLAVDEQEARLADVLRHFLEINDLPCDSVKFETLESDVLGRPVRAVLSFMANCVTGHEALPKLIRQLERFIRAEVKVPIEILAGEQKDRNKLRRMIVVAKGSVSTG
jgi:hypothetical protein